ncbi:MAG: Trm112 family protein [Caulobacteraceae bacterium]
MTETAEPVAVDPRLLEVLVCPLTHTTLEYDRARGELISKAANLAYPIRNGVPIMLPEEARALVDTVAGALPAPGAE